MGSRFSDLFDPFKRGRGDSGSPIALEDEAVQPPQEAVAAPAPVQPETPSRFSDLFTPQPQQPGAERPRAAQLDSRFSDLFLSRPTVERTTDFLLPEPEPPSGTDRLLDLTPEERERAVSEVQERFERIDSPVVRSFASGLLSSGASLKAGAQRLTGQGDAAEKTIEADAIAREAVARANKDVKGFKGVVVKDLPEVTRSLAIAGVLRPAGAVGIIAGFGVDAYNRGLSKARRAGLDEKKARASARIQAAIEIGVTSVFQRFAPGFEGLITKGIGKSSASNTIRAAIKDTAKGVTKAIAQELPEENIIEQLQAINEHYSQVDPNALNFVDEDGNVDSTKLGKLKRAIQRTADTSRVTAATVGIAASPSAAARLVEPIVGEATPPIRPDGQTTLPGIEPVEAEVQEVTPPEPAEEVAPAQETAQIDEDIAPQEETSEAPPPEPEVVEPVEPEASEEPQVVQEETTAPEGEAIPKRVRAAQSEQQEQIDRNLPEDILVDEDGAPVGQEQSGAPLTVTVFRGEGRNDAASAFSDERFAQIGNIFGEGRYSAINRQEAQEFGPNVAEREVALQNPLVIDSDAQLQEIFAEQEAVMPTSPEAGRFSPEQIQEGITRVRESLVKRGHDGIVINIPGLADINKRGESVQRLRELAGSSQVIEFNPKPSIEDVPEQQRFEAVTPQENVRVRGRFKIVEADELVTSDEQGFDQSLQPRNRDTASSREQIAQISTKPDASRLAESATTDVGAPLVNSDNNVISGNGRVIGLRQAFESDRAGEFVSKIAEKAEALGLSTEGFARPVLVREVIDTGGETIQRVAELSNRPQILERTDAELAEADAKLLVEKGLIAQFSPDASGNIRAASNTEFLKAFVNETGAQNLRKSDGGFAPSIEARVKRAVLSAVFQGSPNARQATIDAIENADALGVKRQLDGITLSAPRLLQIADSKPELDIVPFLGEATEQFIAFKKDPKSRSIDAFLGQQDFFSADLPQETEIILRALDGAKSAKSVRDLFDRYSQLADNVDTASASLFEDVPTTSARELLEIASNAGQQPAERQGTLPEGAPGDTGEGVVLDSPAPGSGGARNAVPAQQAPRPQVTTARPVSGSIRRRFHDIGMDARRTEFKRKDGAVEEHVVIRAPEDPELDQTFKDLGQQLGVRVGRFDDAQSKTGRAWHFFPNPPAGIEQTILNAVSRREVDTSEDIEELQAVNPTRQTFEFADSPEVRPQNWISRIFRPRGVTRSTSASAVMDSLENTVRAFGSNAPIRVGRGRFAQRKALGTFFVKPEVIRIRTANDISTATHEVAHAIEKSVYGFEKNPWVDDTNIGKQMRGELLRLGKALYRDPKRKPAGGYHREGFAEFVRMYVTEPESAEQLAPEFHKWFEETFLPGNPDGAAALRKSRELAQTWRNQGAKERGKRSIVDPAAPSERLRRSGKGARRFVSKEKQIDMFAPFEELVREVEAVSKKKLKKLRNPEFIAKSLRGVHHARARIMVEKNMVDLAGNPVGPALNDIRSLVKRKERTDFTIYLWARRAESLWLDPLKPEGRNPGLSLEDAQEIIEDVESDAKRKTRFQLAAQKVYDWNDGVLNYAAQASPSFAEVVDRVRESDPGNYIPLQRAFRDLDARWARSGSVRASKGSPVKRLKGSGREIKDPLQTMIANATNTIRAAHTRMIIDSIMKVSNIEGMGHLVEEIPPTEAPVAARDVQSLIDEINRNISAQGLGVEVVDAEGQAVNTDDADLAGTLITFFSPRVNPDGKDPIFPVFDRGKVRWFQLEGQLFDALEGLETVAQIPKIAGLPIMEWLFAKPKRLFTAGTTGFNVSFQLVTNPQRDGLVFLVNSQSSANAFEMVQFYLKGVVDVFTSIPSGKHNPVVDAAINLGIEMAQPLGTDLAATRELSGRVFDGRVAKIINPARAFETFREIIQVPERIPRTAEIEAVARDIGWEPGTPMTLEQSMRMLLAGKEVTTDFSAMGEVGRTMNAMVPFWNPAIQGPRANIRAAQRNPKKFFLRAISAVTLPTLALWWKYKDEEWYTQMPWREKFLFWHIPTEYPEPTLIRIARPFEIGNVFAALPEMIFDSFYRQNPRAAKEWFRVFIDTTIPSALPVLPGEAAQQLANKDFFWDRPIEPQGLSRQPGEERFTEYTTRAARIIGQVLDKVPGLPENAQSPARIDHALQGIAGPVTRDVLKAIGLGPTLKELDPEAADLPIVGRAFQRGGRTGRSPQPIQDVYEQLEPALRRKNSVQNPETIDEADQRVILEDTARAISGIFAVRATTKSAKDREFLTKEATELAKDALRDVEEIRKASR